MVPSLSSFLLGYEGEQERESTKQITSAAEQVSMLQGNLMTIVKTIRRIP